MQQHLRLLRHVGQRHEMPFKHILTTLRVANYEHLNATGGQLLLHDVECKRRTRQGQAAYAESDKART
jgi:hypothetical protein